MLKAWICNILLGASLLAGFRAAAQTNDGQIAGEPWVGAPGKTETISQIMDREKHRPPQANVAATMLKTRKLNPHPKEEDSGEEVEGEGPMVVAEPPGRYPGRPKGSGGPFSPQAVGTNFFGIQLSESGYIPPDSMGAVGPSQFLVCANGRIKVFNKNGTLGPLNTTTDNLFTSVTSSGTSDPHLRYDRLTGRWFITIIDLATPNRVLIAVSSGPTITGTGSFTFFQFQHDLVGTTPNTDTGGFADYDTLGVDAHALYIGANVFNAAGNAVIGTTGFVVNKTNLLAGTLTVTAFRQIGSANGTGSGMWTPQGVDNDDPASTEGYFIGMDNFTFSRAVIRRVSNPGGTPTLSANLNITVPATYNPIGQVHKGDTQTNKLDSLDDRLFAAHIKKNKLTGVSSLWTAHNIRVNSSGTGTSAGTRNGSRWYEFRALTTTPTLFQSGTLFDSSATNPRGYWIPSVAANGQGHMALGCSYAGSNDFAGVAVAGRLFTDATGATQPATLAVVSTTAYNLTGEANPHRWGDYSQVTVDPNDDMTLWTAQEYCNAANSWAMRVVQLLAPPPATPTNASPASVAQSSASVNVVVNGLTSSGSGFFDPGADSGGPGFAKHITAAVDGGGVTVNSVTFTDPTNITLNVTIAAGAALGARTITVTNPDSQFATSASGLLTINASVPVANFTGTPTNGAAPLSVAFTNLSTGSTNFTWDFGDGNTSSVTNPPHTFTNTGTYAVTLTAIGPGGTNILTRTGYIVVTNPPPPVANFTGAPTNGLVPLTVTFTNLSTTATNYAWTFGDGSTSSAANPLHTFTNAGTFDVTLTAVGPSGTNVLPRTGYIVVTNPPPPVANFTGTPTNGLTSLTVAFTNLSTTATNYFWDFGDGSTSSVTNPPHTFTNAGSYTVALTAVGTSGTNTLTRAAYIVATNAPPTITNQPQSLLVNLGADATFTVAATGTTPFTYQWRLRGTNIPGAAASAYTRTNAQIVDIGNYSVVVSNVAGGATSSNAALNVIVVPGVITLNGEPYSEDFDSMGASGTTPPFGWYVGTGTAAISGTTITAGTGSSGTGGNYNFGVAGVNPVTDRALGSLASSSTQRDTEARFVNVSGALITAFTISYTGEEWRVGGGAVNNDLVLQYSTNGTNFSAVGATFDFNTPIDSGTAAALDGNAAANRVTGIGDSYTPALAITNNQVFYLRWADTDSTSSDNAMAVDDFAISFTLSNPPPAISLHPQSLAVNQDSNALFSITVAPSLSLLSYQWRSNAVVIAGATADSFTLTNAQCSDAGNFDVVVANAGGSLTSSVAALTVIAPPAITTPPADQSVAPGQTAIFTIGATNGCGDTPVYQWQFAGTNIAGATTNTYSRTNAQPADAGGYTVVVGNSAGSITSVIATLTLLAPPAMFTISGTVELQAFAGTNRLVRFIASEVTGVATNLLQTTNMNLTFSNGAATYTLPVPTNTTHISAKTAWNLRRKLASPFSGGLATVDFTGAASLKGGDIVTVNGGTIDDTDNAVTSSDYLLLLGNYLQTVGGDPAIGRADIDGDGAITSADYLLLLGNYLQAGDSP